MSKSTTATLEDFKRLGLIETADGTYKKAATVLAEQEKLNTYDLDKQAYVPKEKMKDKKANKKVIGATKVVVDGITYDSKLESYVAAQLKLHNIPFEFQVPFLLQEGFKYMGKKIQTIYIIPDFYLPENELIIDSKGWATSVSKLKFKMLKFKLKNEDKHIEIVLPSTQKEVDAIILKLLKV